MHAETLIRCCWPQLYNSIWFCLWLMQLVGNSMLSNNAPHAHRPLISYTVARRQLLLSCHTSAAVDSGAQVHTHHISDAQHRVSVLVSVHLRCALWLHELCCIMTTGFVQSFAAGSELQPLFKRVCFMLYSTTSPDVDCSAACGWWPWLCSGAIATSRPTSSY